MPKIDVQSAPQVHGSRYPAPYDLQCSGRHRRCLGDVVGLQQFGVNLTTLAPGAWSSQRHWHTVEDEFVFVVEGELVLVTDDGETTLKAGDCAGFPAGTPNGHHLQNRTERPARYLDIGGRRPDQDEAFFPDIDLHVLKGRAGYAHRDGRPYEGVKPRNPATGE